MYKQIFLWFFIIFLIVLRFFTTRPVYKAGDMVRITSSVYSDPVIYPTSQYLKLAGLKVYLPKVPEIDYGDTVTVVGIVGDGVLDNPKITGLKQGGPVSNLRNSIISFYGDTLPQPESGLLSGIVLGAKGAMDPDFYNLTKTAGVAHVVVASGTNVTFVISFLTAVLFIFLPRRKAIPFVILGIILYLFLSGFDAPLIRAAIMAGVVFTAQEMGRLSSTWRIFFLTAGVMLIYRPDWITDTGFLLSFASTGSLMLFQKRVEQMLRKVPGFVRQDIATSISAQIGVTPILYVIFGQFNIWSPFINSMVLWTIPPLMIIGTLGGMIGLIMPAAGKFILYLGYPLLWWFTKVVQI